MTMGAITRLTEAMKDILRSAKIEGNALTLQGQLDRKAYVEINEVLELLGGKRNRGKKCHIFDIDNLQEAIDEVVENGEVVDLKKLYQQYYTPAELARRVVALADIQDDDIVLEPSAGQGAIVNELPTQIQLTIVELDPRNVAILKSVHRDDTMINIIEGDFLQHSGEYTKIVMNPPFTNSQDVKHILHAYSLLKEGGRMVAIASSSIQSSETKPYKELKALNPEFIEVDDGAFKESGTMVNSIIVILNK